MDQVISFLSQANEHVLRDRTCWSIPYQAATTLFLDLRESIFEAKRTKLSGLFGLFDLQIHLLKEYAPEPEKTDEISQVLLNALRVANWWNDFERYQKYKNLFQLHGGEDYNFEANILFAETLIDMTKHQRQREWYLDADLKRKEIIHFESPISYGLRAFELARQKQNPSELFVAMHLLSSIYIASNSRLTEIQTMLQSCESLIEQIEKEDLRAIIDIQYGLYHYHTHNWGLSEEYFVSALENLHASKDSASYQLAIDCLIVLYKREENLDTQKVEEHYSKAIDVSRGGDFPDRLWELPLGFSVWLIERHRHFDALFQIFQAIEGIEEALESNHSVLHQDKIGPWILLSKLVKVVTGSMPQTEKNRWTKKLIDNYHGMKDSFPDAENHIQLVLNSDCNQTISPEICFPLVPTYYLKNSSKST